MKSVALITASAFLAITVVVAEDGDDGLEVSAPFLPEMASAGMDFDAPPWKNAGQIASFSKIGSVTMLGMSFSEEAKQPTRVLLARDREALYIAFECTDPKPDDLKTDPPEDKNAFPYNDRVEMYLEGDQAAHQAYYHLAFGAAGERWRSLNHQRIDTGTWTVLVKIEADRWKAIVRIPYETLGLTASAESTRGIFYRMYRPHDMEIREQTTWGGRGVHQPAQFGTIRFEPIPTTP